MTANVVLGIAVLVVGYIFASLFYPLLLGGAGYTPTPRREVAEALRLADLKRDEVFYDLGCGTGEALLEALTVCDHVRGVEIEPLRWLIARTRARGARVVLGDLFAQDISDADVVFVFQYRGKINARVGAKIRAGTQAGTRVISYGYPMAGLKLVKRRDEIFLYTT